MSTPNRFRFGLHRLLFIQLLIAPAFLSKTYFDRSASIGGWPLLVAVACFVAPPILYAFLFSMYFLRGAKPASFLISGVRIGGAFGLLFGALAWGTIPFFRLLGFVSTLLVQIWQFPSIPNLGVLQALLTVSAVEVSVIVAFVAVHYAVLGAIGGMLASVAIPFSVRKLEAPSSASAQ